MSSTVSNNNKSTNSSNSVNYQTFNDQNSIDENNPSFRPIGVVNLANSLKRRLSQPGNFLPNTSQSNSDDEPFLTQSLPHSALSPTSPSISAKQQKQNDVLSE